MSRSHKPDAPSRSATEVGPGDFVKVGQTWMKIEKNSAHGAAHTPRSWTVTAENGRSYGMFDVNRYAKAEDIAEDTGPRRF